MVKDNDREEGVNKELTKLLTRQKVEEAVNELKIIDLQGMIRSMQND